MQLSCLEMFMTQSIMITKAYVNATMQAQRRLKTLIKRVKNLDLDETERQNYNNREIDAIIAQHPWNVREWIEKQIEREIYTNDMFVLVHYIGGTIDKQHIKQIMLYRV